MKKKLTTIVLALAAAWTFAEGTILHCWCWSFGTIEANMEKIADAGYTHLQTSPANTCLIGENGGMELMSTSSGKWYYHYQPVDFKIGNYQLGTRDQFISMCAKAHEYGIKVIVDIVPNHTTPLKDQVSKELVDAVGGMEKLYHKGKGTGLRNYDTNTNIGGLPDIDTENPLFQEYFLSYLDDLVDCGADGFRIDCAKHIGLPDDPRDDPDQENNFYPVITRKTKNAKNLFIYGEVLQDQTSREDAYGEYIWVTASNYGKVLRSSVKNRKLSGKGLVNLQNKASPKVVTWVESHDTYANKGESASLTDFEIRAAWAVIASRRDGIPLFFSRPKGKEGMQFPGESKIGDAGSDLYFHPEVAAVNKFRKAMKDEPNMFLNGETEGDGANKINPGLLFIRRGSRGIAIINMNTTTQKIRFKCGLPSGTYKDRAWGIKFKVKNSFLEGLVPPERIAVVYSD